MGALPHAAPTLSPKQASRPLLKFAVTYLIVLVTIWPAYRHTNVTFLRADSGYYQLFAHATPAKQHEMLLSFWKSSVDGHYTPVAFTSEFFFTKLAGTHAIIWRCRQIAAVALVGTLLFTTASSFLVLAGLTTAAARFAAAGVALTFLFHPLTTDFVAWPFHILQLEWMAIATTTLWLLTRLATRPDERRWIWLSAFCGYAAMHALGLGFITAVATATVLLLLLILIANGKFSQSERQTASLRAALITLTILTVVHSVCMLALVAPHEVRPVPHSYSFGLAHALGLTGLYPMFAVMSLPGLVVETLFTADIVRSAWPFGVLLLLATICCTGGVLRACWRASEPVQALRAAVFLFSAASFFAFLLMISVRQWRLPSLLGIFGYLTGPRYLMPAMMTMLGVGLWAISFARGRWALSVGWVAFSIGVATLVAHPGYERRMPPRIAALDRISHEEAWTLIIAVAQESRAAHLPIPNIPLGSLTQEFDTFELKLFEPLLRAGLGTSPAEKLEFIDWKTCRETERDVYAKKVPSLARLMTILHLR